MKGYLGIDTSNYTTSTAVYCPEHDLVLQKKKLLPVPAGALGLRQSDAVFHHTVQLPQLLEEPSTARGRWRAPICPVFWPGCLLRVRLRLF